MKKQSYRESTTDWQMNADSNNFYRSNSKQRGTFDKSRQILSFLGLSWRTSLRRWNSREWMMSNVKSTWRRRRRRYLRTNKWRGTTLCLRHEGCNKEAENEIILDMICFLFTGQYSFKFDNDNGYCLIFNF